MKSRWGAVILVAGLTACTRQPPPAESHYVPSAVPTQSAAAQAPDEPSSPTFASFIDNFDRPDTPLGLGEGWDMRSAPSNGYPLPPAADGFIKDNYFGYAGKDDVHAIREFRGELKTVGGVGRFRVTGLGGLTMFSMGISAADDLSANVVGFVSSRSFWALKIRAANGVDQTVATDKYNLPLEPDHDYQFELSTNGTTATIKGPGLDVTKNLSAAIPPGVFGYWRLFPTRAPLGDFFDFKTVWAVEDGQPVFPVPGTAP